MSSTESIGGGSLEAAPNAFAIVEDEESRLQEAVDILIDFMAVATALWARGERRVSLELAAYAGVALDEVIELSRLRERVENGVDARLPSRIRDFRVLLDSLGGDVLGDVVYWAAEALVAGDIPTEASLLINEFLDFNGVPLKDMELERMAVATLKYVVASFNKALATMAIEA